MAPKEVDAPSNEFCRFSVLPEKTSPRKSSTLELILLTAISNTGRDVEQTLCQQDDARNHDDEDDEELGGGEEILHVGRQLDAETVHDDDQDWKRWRRIKTRNKKQKC